MSLDYSQDLKAALKFINQYQRFILITHVHPDPDAYGSLLSMEKFLHSLGKETYPLNESAPVPHLDYLKGDTVIHSTFPESAWDAVITLDCGDKKRVGDNLLAGLNGVKILNIDHHVSNDMFGDVNVVGPRASSTCEMLFELFCEYDKSKITKEIGKTLLAGIVSDTGSFRYSNTSQRTLEIASQIVALGVTTHSVGRILYGKVPRSTLQLQSEALLNMEFYEDGKIALVTVTDELLKKHKAGIEATNSLTERARDIEGVQIAASIRAYEDIWKVSMRSHDEKIDVSKVAVVFGGGGHKPAAAFRWRGTYGELKKELLLKCKEVLQ